jgi:hypothetical protein
MTKRSACRYQLLNEVEGAENAGTLGSRGARRRQRQRPRRRSEGLTHGHRRRADSYPHSPGSTPARQSGALVAEVLVALDRFKAEAARVIILRSPPTRSRPSGRRAVAVRLD